MNHKYQLRITGRTYQHFADKQTPCPENNHLKRRTRWIQKPARPPTTTRDYQPRMGGMGRRGDNYYC